jgi:predicted nucleic acid-binding protein
MQARPRSALFLSVLTLGEIRKGIDKVEEGARKRSLVDWLEVELPHYFVGRMLGVDGPVADRWGRLMARAARPVAAVDGLLAATAIHHDLTLVTRNTRDFAGIDVSLFNPWED